MKKIDKETVTRILDTADIVEVVSDFVSLKKRGANYIGLCPFHNERTPSFSVSKAKGICHCFSCGKGGSPVGFLMELEQMSYQEALRWLAKKYNIEIQEHEETEKEKQENSARESLFAINNFALDSFENILHNTEDGREIGLAYFVERGLTLETIKKFHLGYAHARPDALSREALKEGYTVDALVKAGLCYETERGLLDRFRGRVIYPVHSVAGKVVAFGGRTLTTDKKVAKYVNSPESAIYSKSRELYGLFQARRAIVKEDKCYLVEGYMDVLSMSQSGVENVVASSGTSLTTQQIRLMHRFTGNVTVIYDADPAGIKASLRGIDMLLSEGMDVKVVLFPTGEDPDSFAQSHTKTELEEYLRSNETDFIKFKTSILLSDSGNDPLKRSNAIADILRSIAAIPDSITRQVYIEETSRSFGMDPKLLSLTVAKGVASIAEEAFLQSRRDKAVQDNEQETPSEENVSDGGIRILPENRNILYRHEYALLRYLVRYGMMIIGEEADDEGNMKPMTVYDYVRFELDDDSITFSDGTLARLFDMVGDMTERWDKTAAELMKSKDEHRRQLMDEGLERIRNSATSLAEINKAEKDLETNIEAVLYDKERAVRREFFEHDLLSVAENDIRKAVTDMVSDKYQLSKYHSKYTTIETEEAQLHLLVPRAVYELKDAILQMQIASINAQLRENSADAAQSSDLLAQLMDKMQIRTRYAQYLGDRIITPNRL